MTVEATNDPAAAVFHASASQPGGGLAATIDALIAASPPALIAPGSRTVRAGTAAGGGQASCDGFGPAASGNFRCVASGSDVPNVRNPQQQRPDRAGKHAAPALTTLVQPA